MDYCHSVINHEIDFTLYINECFAEVLSDRFAIKSGNADNVVLSAQQLVDCDTRSFGCNGGFPLKAWEYYMTEVG